MPHPMEGDKFYASCKALKIGYKQTQNLSLLHKITSTVSSNFLLRTMQRLFCIEMMGRMDLIRAE